MADVWTGAVIMGLACAAVAWAGHRVGARATRRAPVVFVAGDQALVDQAKDLFGDIPMVATKQGIGEAARSLIPAASQERIRSGVAQAVRDRGQAKPFAMSAPYTLVLKLKTEASVYAGSFFPGAKRTGPWELTFTSDDILQVMYAFNVMKR